MVGAMVPAKVFECIMAADISTAERKFLRKRAVEVAAAPAAAAPAQPGGFALACFEELKAELVALEGEAVGLGRLRRWLLSAARPDPVKRVEAMVRCRRWDAHPDVLLVADVSRAVSSSCGSLGVREQSASLAKAAALSNSVLGHLGKPS